ncbi:MAG TPA: hypothetical protein VFU13_06310 [Steroidobacteraceae bacterium]|nr:hypothetical protein [Steroidobacteraceae bacterium]
MNKWNNILVLAAAVFSGISAHAGPAGATNFPLTGTTRPAGFLNPSDRRAPRTVEVRYGGLVDRLCARATGHTRVGCPTGLNHFDGPGSVGTYAPHLRLNIILKEMRNVVVAGAGVDSLGAFQEPWATFKIVSAAADVSIPTPAAPPYGLPVPAPGDTWSDIPHANALYQGIIWNGCLGVPATFDLTLDSSIFRISTGEVLGSVHLVDEVEGHGYYNFKYTITATDENGNVSNFVFSGDADSICTAQANF